MTITHQKLTLSEYLNYQDNTDNFYEFVEGELIPMSLEGNMARSRND
ncbi:MAG: hypothetical protein ACKO4S_00320 [Snowella sp.]